MRESKAEDSSEVFEVLPHESEISERLRLVALNDVRKTVDGVINYLYGMLSKLLRKGIETDVDVRVETSSHALNIYVTVQLVDVDEEKFIRAKASRMKRLAELWERRERIKELAKELEE